MEEMTSMHFDKKLDVPSLKRRGKFNERLHWIARADIAKAGFLPKTVRLHYDENNYAHRPLIEATCHKLQARNSGVGRLQAQQRSSA